MNVDSNEMNIDNNDIVVQTNSSNTACVMSLDDQRLPASPTSTIMVMDVDDMATTTTATTTTATTTPTSVAAERKKWLEEFGKKNRDHFDANQVVHVTKVQRQIHRWDERSRSRSPVPPPAHVPSPHHKPEALLLLDASSEETLSMTSEHSDDSASQQQQPNDSKPPAAARGRCKLSANVLQKFEPKQQQQQQQQTSRCHSPKTAIQLKQEEIQRKLATHKQPKHQTKVKWQPVGQGNGGTYKRKFVLESLP